MAKKAKKHPMKKGSGSHFDRFIITGILISLVLIAVVLWGPFRKFRPLVEKKQAPQAGQQEPAAITKPSAKKPVTAHSRKEPPKHNPVPALLGNAAPSKTVQIAIVIDDLGMDMKQARDVISLPAKITFAVMPGLAQSRNVAELAEQNSHEVLIHVPMEYRGKNGKPAPGILRSDMTPMEFLTTVSSDLESVPGAVGINNHEGSALTENKEAMKFLMAELKARNLMFLDSLTSPKSVAYATAKEFGLRSGKRDVFLDNEIDNPVSIRKQLDELVEVARKNGKAIGIGHPHPVTIIELRKWLADAGNQGFEIVPVSRLMQ
ncbi:MAG TPA: divergent polysaccharide deacetylase family protein [Nitrospirota bacterium]|nr:divergent polysaccharide deacetylase family protein [Nitrospirota bacterium]